MCNPSCPWLFVCVDRSKLDQELSYDTLKTRLTYSEPSGRSKWTQNQCFVSHDHLNKKSFFFSDHNYKPNFKRLFETQGGYILRFRQSMNIFFWINELSTFCSDPLMIRFKPANFLRFSRYHFWHLPRNRLTQTHVVAIDNSSRRFHYFRMPICDFL